MTNHTRLSPVADTFPIASIAFATNAVLTGRMLQREFIEHRSDPYLCPVCEGEDQPCIACSGTRLVWSRSYVPKSDDQVVTCTDCLQRIVFQSWWSTHRNEWAASIEVRECTCGLGGYELSGILGACLDDHGLASERRCSELGYTLDTNGPAHRKARLLSQIGRR